MLGSWALEDPVWLCAPKDTRAVKQSRKFLPEGPVGGGGDPFQTPAQDICPSLDSSFDEGARLEVDSGWWRPGGHKTRLWVLSRTAPLT